MSVTLVTVSQVELPDGNCWTSPARGSNVAEKVCASAGQAGVVEIAFTDHLNNHLMDIDLGYYNPDRYFTDLEYCRTQFPGLTIRAGIELGEPHRWADKILPLLERYPYDVVLGSLHW